ncbi:hypothetical protein EY643_06320 [Halioglobus maricola]|uniref:Uncharacterized protein n=1 Tax=Halioglobus maricola TaxID=2601894 RepID=A0A5P9NIE3_9GAMM|nr:hypothetical protein EY643_06320 [Halioglobus maricola]
MKELQLNIDALSKARKDKKQRTELDPVMERWFRFGGGFYGVVALYTWLYIEFDDVVNFLQGLANIVFDFSPSGLFQLILELFIESIMNFVWAIAWPAYWLSESRDAWMMLFVGYAGYWLGIKAAAYARRFRV